MLKIINQFIQFVKEAYSELKKVSWLDRKQVIASTAVIIIFVVILAVFIGLVDFILARLLGIVLGGRI